MIETIDVLARLMRRIGHKPGTLRDPLGFDILLGCETCRQVFYIWTNRTSGDVIMTDGKILGRVSDEIPLKKIKEYMCERFQIMK